MKKLIDNAIIFFSYRYPHLWLEINEMIFDEIEGCKKKQKDKIINSIQKLIRRVK